MNQNSLTKEIVLIYQPTLIIPEQITRLLVILGL